MDKVGSLTVRWAQGYNGKKAKFIDETTMCYACGSNLKFIDVKTKTEQVFQSPGTGISTFAVSPAHKVFAIAESNAEPKIFICSYPEMEVINVLKGGTPLEYSMITFSRQENYLAAFTGVPDFALTVWNWSTEELLTKYEFGEDCEMISIDFNPTNYHHLVLLGRTSVVVFYLERCNELYTLKMNHVNIPIVQENFSSDDLISRPATRMGFNVTMSHAAKAGLTGPQADDFIPSSMKNITMKPVSFCWTSKGEIFVGSQGGFLFSVDIESIETKIYLGVNSEQYLNGDLPIGMFNTLTINSNGLFAGGLDGSIRKISLIKDQIKIKTIWQASSSILSLDFSPTTFTVLGVGVDSGSLWTVSAMKHEANLVSENNLGQFIGAGYSSEETYCISCREEGELEVWNVETGSRISHYELQTRATTIAVCPCCSVVAVGTWDGYICYVDISNVESPRQIKRERLHRSPVGQLCYSTDGQVLISYSNEEHEIFVLRSKPSDDFECIGYIDCGGPVKHVTISKPGNNVTYVTAVVTPTSEQADNEEASEGAAVSDRIVTFTIPKEVIKNPVGHHASLRKNFLDKSISKLSFDLTVPVDSAVVFEADSHLKVISLNELNKKLNYFKLPNQLEESTDFHNPAEEYESHELEGGSLEISAHATWIISYAPDGMFKIRSVNAMGKEVSQQGHSFVDGGVLTVKLAVDGQSLLSVGKNDSSLVCYQWNLTTEGKAVINSAIDFARIEMMQRRSVTEEQKSILARMPEWVAPVKDSSTRGGSAVSKADFAISQTEVAEAQGTPAHRVLSTTRSEVTMTPTPVPENDATWLEIQLAAAVKQENARYDEAKRNLRYEIKSLRKTIMEMMKLNLLLPEIEQLSHEEYNLDVEEQARLQKESEQKIQDVRESIDFENLAQQYLKYVIQKECWDDMVIKGRALLAFNTNIQVTNFPMLAQPSIEAELLKKIERIRNIEIAENKIRNEIVELPTTTTLDEDEDDEETHFDPDKQLSLHGSIGPKHGGANELFYSQFELHAREEKISQIILLKDALRRIKTMFNQHFSAVYRNKEQELNRIKEKNVRIREIMQELDLDDSKVKDPSMNIEEKPERVLVVENEEVKVELILSEEQQKVKEEQEKVEEEKRKAEEGDNKRERGLKDMMDGVLEVKKEDLLKQDVPRPEFVEEKLEKDFTDEEKKMLKEYEKKQKDLLEEREKYKKNLESELKKLQQTNAESTASFDDALLQLYNRKIKVDMAVNQEELKILRLTKSILMDDEFCAQEEYINDKSKRLQAAKNHSIITVLDVSKKVEDYQETYDSITAEDKLLDRGFKRDFSDVPLSLVDQLYKLFKRRPRIQRQRDEENEKSFNPYGTNVTTSVGGDGRPPIVNPDSSIAILNALEELDDISNAPEGCDEIVWQRLCAIRRNKTESEIKVKSSAGVLAEMTQYLNERKAEDEKLSEEIEEITNKQVKLCEDRMKNDLNLDVQFLLKQGQVEVQCGDFIPDYSDCILIHRGVVEDLNGTIRTLGESKIAAMTESKDFKKGIHQLEWERKRMMMQMEDLHNRSRRVQNLKLTKDLQSFLNEENHQSKQSRKISVLEQTLSLQDKHFEKDINYKQSIIDDLEHTVKQKAKSNTELDGELEELHVAVSERRNITEVNAAERAKNTADKRLHGIVQRRKLVDLAKAQAQEVAVLRAEVERLRMKTFPALVQVEH